MSLVVIQADSQEDSLVTILAKSPVTVPADSLEVSLATVRADHYTPGPLNKKSRL